jgi:hypothetical protein
LRSAASSGTASLSSAAREAPPLSSRETINSATPAPTALPAIPAPPLLVLVVALVVVVVVLLLPCPPEATEGGAVAVENGCSCVDTGGVSDSERGAPSPSMARGGRRESRLHFVFGSSCHAGGRTTTCLHTYDMGTKRANYQFKLLYKCIEQVQRRSQLTVGSSPRACAWVQ